MISVATLQYDLELIMRMMAAVTLGGLIGWERERHGISAGIRTYGAISLGACVFGLISLSIPNSDASRVAAQVVTGIGFLCGGIIFRQGENYISGLTTAATLWATAAVGLAIAFSMYVISVLTAVLIFILLLLPHLRWWKKISKKHSSRLKDD